MALSEKDVAAQRPVTVVLLQRVRDGADEEYRRWQDQTDALAANFPGFLGVEVTPPSGIQTDWLIVYRFATEQELRAWLDSTELASQRREGEQYFASPPRQVTAIAPPSPDSQVVSVVIRHRIRPGQEAAYQHWQQELAAAQDHAAGYLGAEVIPPAPGSNGVWSVILRFNTPEHLEAWMKSEARQRLLERGKKIYEDFDETRVRGGFDGWFQFGQGGGVVEVPPVWKQALTVLVGLYPTVMVLSLLVTRHLTWGLPGAILFGNILSTIILSWFLMPIVNRLLQFWLRPAGSDHTAVDIGGVVLIAATLVVLLVLFQIVTPLLS